MNSLAMIGNLFSGDGLIIFMILLLLFGAKKLPELARGLGGAVREFSKAKDEVEREMSRPANLPEPRVEAPHVTDPHIAGTDSYHQEHQTYHPVTPEPAVPHVTPAPHVAAAAATEPRADWRPM